MKILLLLKSDSCQISKDEQDSVVSNDYDDELYDILEDNHNDEGGYEYSKPDEYGVECAGSQKSDLFSLLSLITYSVSLILILLTVIYIHGEF